MCPRGPIPDRLRALEAASDLFTVTRAWDELSDSVYHQGDVFLGSYAAVPHMVRICAGDRNKLDYNLFLWVGAIEEARLTGRRNPPLPADFERSYADAMAAMHKLVFDLSAEPWGTTLAQCIMAWQLAAKGFAEAAERITELPWPRDGGRK
jgi:hypothetical protein